MNLLKDKYIILEIIPTNPDPNRGDVAQISALKINKAEIEDRFDYRLNKSKIQSKDILNMTNYDNESFKYASKTATIMNNFKKFISDLPLLIIDNEYTRNYLMEFTNEKISVFKYLNLSISDDVFDRLINKYNLEPSNYLVDLLYEALMMEL